MNKQDFLKSFQKWRAKNGYAKRDFCRDILRAFKKADISLQGNGIDDICAIHEKFGERPEWIDYVLQQSNPSTFIGQLFNKDNNECVTLNDPTTSSNNRLSKSCDSEKEKQDIIEVFYNFIKTYNYVPELKELNYSGNIKKYFKTEKELYTACAGMYDLSGFSFNENTFTDEYFNKILEKTKQYKRFIITSAVTNKKADKLFIKSIKNYCAKNDALCLVLPCQDTFSKKAGFEYQLDPELKDFCIAYKDLQLNNNLYLSNIKVSAKMINPLTGLSRLAVDSSVILASPKLFSEPIPNANKNHPHYLMTTGVCTLNDYDNDLYMSHRISKIAEHKHSISAIIVEIQDDNIFHFRQVERNNEGAFTDLGYKYTPDGFVYKVELPDLVVGDLHVSELNEKVYNQHLKLISELGVNNIVLHDIMTHESISHHNVKKTITKAVLESEGKLSLQDEANMCGSKIAEILGIIKGEIDIVYSNHHNFLSRYIEDGRYAFDSKNLYYSLDLVKAFLEGQDPFKYMILNKTDLNTLSDEEFYKINFLEKLEDKKRYGVEISNHGSYGANGSKGSPKIYAKAFKKSISGHIHYGSINDSAWTVGTCGVKDPIYVNGLSSWTHTSCIIYQDGTRQLINFIENKDSKYTWRI